MHTKLNAIADKLTPKIEACMADRLTNTPKRLAQAMSKRAEGVRLQRTHDALRALAHAHETGTVPAELAHVKTTAAMCALMHAKMEPVRNGYHGYHIDTGEPANDTPEVRAAWALLSGPSPEQEHKLQVERALADLQFTNIPGYFPTPRPVVERMLSHITLSNGDLILEPSAGSGAIVDVVRELSPQACIDAFEVNYSLFDLLTLKRNANVVRADFLTVTPDPQYDYVLMNPPFEGMVDADHVQHAYLFLKPGGRLVAIMSTSAFFRSDKKAVAFREWFDDVGGVAEDLPEGSFKASGTGVATKLIVIDK